MNVLALKTDKLNFKLMLMNYPELILKIFADN